MIILPIEQNYPFRVVRIADEVTGSETKNARSVFQIPHNNLTN